MGSDDAARKKLAKKLNKLMKHGGQKPTSSTSAGTGTSKIMNPVNILNESGSDDICVEQLLLRVGELDLISRSTLKLNTGRSYGLVGRNGAGKSCLMSAINNGNIPTPERLTKYYVWKEMEDSDVTVFDAVMCYDFQEKLRLEDLIGKENPESDEHENLCGQYEGKFGPKAEHRACELLAGFGFNIEMQKKKVKDFSKSWRMRIALARALFVNPDILLLDNPTQNLDFEALSWLIPCLSNYRKILILSSNSEKLLAVCNEIIEIQMDERVIKHYSDGYTGYQFEKGQVKQEGAKTRSDEFDFGVIPRSPNATEKIEPPLVECMSVGSADNNTPHVLLQFGLNKGSKIGLVGRNGSGKSAFISILAGDDASYDWRVSSTKKVTIKRFTDRSIHELAVTKTGMDHLEKHAVDESSKAWWIAVASTFGISEEELMRPVGHLSDGQRTRLLFAGMAVSKPSVLLFDEPTTHLDIAAVSCLAEALLKWNGAFIVAGHDVRLINLACKEIWLCRNHVLSTWVENNGELEEEMVDEAGMPVTKWAAAIQNLEKEMSEKAAEAGSPVRLGQISIDGPLFLFGNLQKTAWPFVCYKEYIDFFADPSTDGSISLDRYKKIKYMVARAPCQGFKEGYLWIQGEVNEDATYRVQTETGKRFCRTMLKPLLTLKRNGLCFSKLSRENIYVTDEGVVKFKGLRIVEFSEELLKQNIDAAHEIIRALFSENGKNPPRDIQRLLDMMKYKKEKQDIFHFHASLIPLSNTGPFYVKMYDCVTLKMEEGERDKILLKLPYLDNWSTKEKTKGLFENWTSEMQTNRILNMYYAFNKKRYNRPAPQPLPGHTELTAEQIETHKLLVAQDMTDCLRHRKGHRMEHYKGLMKYLAEESDLAVHVRYQEVSCVLQEELYDAGELKALHLEELAKST